MACAGDVPTLETLAAVDLLRQHFPDLKVRVVNVVDLMTLQPPSEHPHGLSDRDFDALFTTDKPIIFAYHGYPWLIHRLTYRRTNHANLHVRGYKEEGTTTTPFDMAVLNDLDRFHLVDDVIDRVPKLGPGRRGLCEAGDARQADRAQAVHHGSTARTCPRSATGSGRATKPVRAGGNLRSRRAGRTTLIRGGGDCALDSLSIGLLAWSRRARKSGPGADPGDFALGRAPEGRQSSGSGPGDVRPEGRPTMSIRIFDRHALPSSPPFAAMLLCLPLATGRAAAQDYPSEQARLDDRVRSRAAATTSWRAR